LTDLIAFCRPKNVILSDQNGFCRTKYAKCRTKNAFCRTKLHLQVKKQENKIIMPTGGPIHYAYQRLLLGGALMQKSDKMKFSPKKCILVRHFAFLVQQNTFLVRQNSI
jgi:hypothetical protein